MTAPVLHRAPVRALHDRLEHAYLDLASASDRFHAKRTPSGVLTGFAGLDASTMNRVLLVTARDARGVRRLLGDAREYFAERRVPWSVQLTPFAEPADAPDVLREEGFHPTSVLSVMTLASPPAPAATPPGVTVRDAGPGDLGLFTRLTMDAFRMPTRYYAALLDINEAWLEHGGRALLAWRNGEPVGTAMLIPQGGVHGVYNVATLRRHRRRGVARALMHAMLDAFADAPDGDVLTLQVAQDSIAERLYASLGFERRYAWTLYVRA